jgi:hypothetical protein
LLRPTSVRAGLITLRRNTANRGRILERHKIWVTKFPLIFLMIFVELLVRVSEDGVSLRIKVPLVLSSSIGRTRSFLGRSVKKSEAAEMPLLDT